MRWIWKHWTVCNKHKNRSICICSSWHALLIAYALFSAALQHPFECHDWRKHQAKGRVNTPAVSLLGFNDVDCWVVDVRPDMSKPTMTSRHIFSPSHVIIRVILPSSRARAIRGFARRQMFFNQSRLSTASRWGLFVWLFLCFSRFADHDDRRLCVSVQPTSKYMFTQFFSYIQIIHTTLLINIIIIIIIISFICQRQAQTAASAELQ